MHAEGPGFESPSLHHREVIGKPQPVEQSAGCFIVGEMVGEVRSLDDMIFPPEQIAQALAGPSFAVAQRVGVDALGH